MVNIINLCQSLIDRLIIAFNDFYFGFLGLNFAQLVEKYPILDGGKVTDLIATLLGTTTMLELIIGEGLILIIGLTIVKWVLTFI